MDYTKLYDITEYSIIKILIAAGADTNQRDGYSRTALCRAIIDENTEIAEVLIEAGASLDGPHDTIPLIYAARYDNVDVVKLILEKGVDQRAHVALMHALATHSLGVAELLIESGTRINERSIDGVTPLMMAIDLNEKSVIELLVKKGADLDVTDICQTTSLMSVSCAGDMKLAKLFIDYGANMDLTDNHGRSALFHACYSGSVKLVEMFLEKGFNIDLQDNTGHTVLMMQILNKIGDPIIISKLLVDKGANLELKNNRAETAFMIAASMSDFNMMNLLITAGADINTVDNYGRTVLFIEPENSSEEYNQTLDYLIDCGVNIDIKDDDGDTALTYAMKNNYTNLAEILMKRQ